MELHAKKVWLPGAVAFLMFLGWYFVLGPVRADQIIRIPYLAVLPFVGATGAYLSRRLKGSVVERILSALFPVFAFAALFGWRVVDGLFFEGVPYTFPHFLAGLSLLLIFSVVGGLLLLLGAWPFCLSRLSEQSPK